MIPDTEIQAQLERTLQARVTALRRRPSEYRTSSLLDELDVRLDDGRELALLVKELGRAALSEEARAVKPELLYDPLREVEVYDRLLPGAGVGTATCYAAVADPANERYWLVLERFLGVELYQIGRRATWEHAARELARIHERLAGREGRVARLVRHDAELLWRWPRRAADFATAACRPQLERIAAGYEPVVRRILELPAGVIHGEFYASHVLVDSASNPQRVCSVDWEMAGIGPRLLDLAALVSGDWTDEDREAVVSAYLGALPAGSRPQPSAFRDGLDACRLHVALQWLGWSNSWSPPLDHASDWMSDALELSRKLGL